MGEEKARDEVLNGDGGGKEGRRALRSMSILWFIRGSCEPIGDTIFIFPNQQLSLYFSDKLSKLTPRQ